VRSHGVLFALIHSFHVSLRSFNSCELLLELNLLRSDALLNNLNFCLEVSELCLVISLLGYLLIFNAFSKNSKILSALVSFNIRD